MERLGLWGEGAPFKNFETFLKTVEEKGLGMAEMLAMEMKSTGMYVSRGLSFKQAEVRIKSIACTIFKIDTHKLQEQDTDVCFYSILSLVEVLPLKLRYSFNCKLPHGMGLIRCSGPHYSWNTCYMSSVLYAISVHHS